LKQAKQNNISRTQVVKHPFIRIIALSKKKENKHGTIFIFQVEITHIWCIGTLNIWRSDNKVPS
jgi:hypothetical protein